MKFIYEHLKYKSISVTNTAKIVAEHIQEVDGVYETKLACKGVITGRVLAVEQHPNADRLKVLNVDLGQKTVVIVTGAPNVAENQIVAVAVPGSTVRLVNHSEEGTEVSDKTVEIKVATLRGIESFGMLCGPDELGLSNQSTMGLHIFPEDTAIGEPLEKLIHQVGVIETDDKGTAHRPDLLSYKGLEQEIAALLNEKFERNIPEYKELYTNTFMSESLDEDDAPVFCVARISKMLNLQSPEWLRKFLIDNGVKVINLPTDATNYVMLTEGSPTHTFDASTLEGNKIIIRHAKEGEIISCLNHQSYELSKTDLVLADASKALDIAGIIGGETSGVSESTTDIILTACMFNPVRIRKTSRKLGVRTEASARFERGSNPKIVLNGFLVALNIIKKYSKGTVTYLKTDGKFNYANPQITVDLERINRFLSVQISESQFKKILTSLNYTVTKDTVTAPWWRNDINCFADVAEDIARHVGYNTIPSITPHLTNSAHIENSHEMVILLRNLLSSRLYEVDMDSMTENSDQNSVEIANPIGPKKYLRTSIVPGLNTLVAQFQRQGFDNYGCFEINNVYLKKDGKLPKQQLRLCVSIGEIKEEANQILALVLHRLHINSDNLTIIPVDPGFYKENYEILLSQSKIGSYGKSKIHGINIYGFELYLDEMSKLANLTPTYKPYHKLPIVKRDIAFIVDAKHLLGDIVKAIQSKSKFIESVVLFDQFSGKNIGDGNQSLALHLSFNPDDKTLTDEEVNAIMENIESNLIKQFGATIR